MQYAWEPKKSASLPPASKEALRALVFREGDRAVSLLSEEAASSPRDVLVLSRLGRARLARGDTKGAIETLQSAVSLGDRRPITLAALGQAQIASESNAAAERTFAQLLDERGAALDAYQLACAQGRQGKVDAAIASLDRAVALGFHDQGLADGDPDLNGVRIDPRYARLFARNQ
jgi:tetratricopeptide (TPR) repeat protein